MNMQKTAVISECGKYRYRLGRRWGDGPRVGFLMLNPSTADANEDDPTIRRCIAFSRAWGFEGIEVGNLFAFRSTLPENLYRQQDPIGPDNDGHLCQIAKDTEMIICAWGNHGTFQGRSFEVVNMLKYRTLAALKITSTGQPGHPLYLRSNSDILPYP